ncbi:hypothetical protein PJF56_03975 [Roseofilum sp. BLCC_M91]|uniref:Uncharacterized protein n=1 Tax=Roseofilum halophilum BLCC-M91 TaxID=3022259 RepID=A0ABT7BFR6_9CYAN|nr:hypothetical protein [Roseofilum halophilum]MDJ1178017.1 hypothetical protein [Roseofilum halophilum BLCC-M91]
MRSSIRRPKNARHNYATQNFSSQFAPKILPTLQRKESQEQSLAQFKPASDYNYTSLHEMYGYPAPVQTQLTIGKPGDAHEQQADAVAHQVVTNLNRSEPQPSQEIQKKENANRDLQQQEQSASERESEPSTSTPLSVIQDLKPVNSSSEQIQRAIGLEIEVAVPVDKMSTTDMEKLRNWTAAEFGDTEADDPRAEFRGVGDTYTLEDLQEDYPKEVAYFLTLSEPKQQEYLEQKKHNKKLKNSLKWVGMMPAEHKKTFLELGSEEVTDSKGIERKGAVYERVDYTRGNYSSSIHSSEEFGKTHSAIAAGSKFVAQVDHDPRVNSGKKPPNHPWRDSDNSALIEIVMQPPANNKDEFDQSMAQITRFVSTVNQKTNNLTTHAQNPFGTNFNLGPFDYPDISQFASLPKEPTHNWKGSVQVNVGIDLREYSDMASWYAESKYSSTDVTENPEAAGLSDEEKEAYDASRHNITRSVEIAEEIIPELKKALPKRTREAKFTEMGNMRGLKGWITHLALHLLGGMTFSGGSSVKNITPILMKTPNTITLKYGFTEAEKKYYDVVANKKKILKLLIQKTGREKTLTMKGWKGDLKTGSGSILSDDNELMPGGKLSIGKFASQDLTGTLTGSTIRSEEHLGVGPVRRGDESVSEMESTGPDGDQRGGAVIEFRQLPGLYDGPDAWTQIGYDFLKEAEARNRRGGVSDDSLDDLVGPEWREDEVSTSRRRAIV